MTVWTISAALGAGGREVAEELAASAGVPLYDRHELARLLHELEPEVSGSTTWTHSRSGSAGG